MPDRNRVPPYWKINQKYGNTYLCLLNSLLKILQCREIKDFIDLDKRRQDKKRTEPDRLLF